MRHACQSERVQNFIQISDLSWSTVFTNTLEVTLTWRDLPTSSGCGTNWKGITLVLEGNRYNPPSPSPSPLATTQSWL